MIPESEIVRRKIKKGEIQVRVPEGFARDGDFAIKYIEGKRYRVTVRLEAIPVID